MHNYTKNSVFPMVFRTLNNLLPSLFWGLLIFGFSEGFVAVSTLASALIHEAGHLLYIFYQRKGIKSFRALPNGLRIKASKSMSYKQERMLYFCGPLSNIMVALVLSFLPLKSEKMLIFLIINLATAISNLLPIEGYDGYGIIRSLLEEYNPHGPWIGLLRVVSCSLIFSFCLLSLYLIDRCGDGYWIFAVFFVSMIKQIDNGISR